MLLKQLQIEEFDAKTNPWAKARYLASGIVDVLWTNDVDEALSFIKAELLQEKLADQ